MKVELLEAYRPPGGSRRQPEPPPAEWAADSLRLSLLALLIVAPLAFGSVHEAAYIPLLVVAGCTGVLSWARGHWARANGADVPLTPARGVLASFLLLVLLQLLPLPPGLLKLLSPGSFSFYDETQLVPLAAWRPISVSPPDTLRGACFFAAMSLIYSTVARDFRERRWRRRLVRVVIGVGFAMTMVALVQAASRQHRIYGLWEPTYSAAIFGPYVNKNHFAGYLDLAVPLALALAAEGLRNFDRAWHRRTRKSWLAFGDSEGGAVIRRLAVAMTLVLGIVAARSRGALMGLVAAAFVLVALLPRRRQAGLLVPFVVALALAWIGLEPVVRTFDRPGVREGRVEIWFDAIRMLPQFPVLGSGFNAFGTAYPRHQTVDRGIWWGEAHNEYLQVLLDTGLAGAFLLARALLAVVRRARQGVDTPLDAGLLAALAAAAAHNLVEFNWQIPANALTFAALAGLAMQRAAVAPPGPEETRIAPFPTLTSPKTPA